MAGEVGAEGEPATDVHHHMKITMQASEEVIRVLGRETDRFACRDAYNAERD